MSSQPSNPNLDTINPQTTQSSGQTPTIAGAQSSQSLNANPQVTQSSSQTPTIAGAQTSQTSIPNPNTSGPQALQSSGQTPTIVSGPTVQKTNLVIDEINRGKEYWKLLEQRESDLKKKQDEATAEQHKQLYPDFYVKRIIVPDYAPNYADCRHIRKDVVNRDALNMKQHINLLAQPRCVSQKKEDPPYILKRKVPGPSHRILQLARPKKRQALGTCVQYGATMQKFCIENCHRNVQEMTFVPVHDAVYFIKLNERKPLIEKKKLMLRMKRLQDSINEAKAAKFHQLLRELYSKLKSSLLIQNKDIKDDQTIKLCHVLQNELGKLLKRPVEPEQGIHFDRLVAHISLKVAVWIRSLLTSKKTETTDTQVQVSQNVTQTVVQNNQAVTQNVTQTQTQTQTVTTNIPAGTPQ